MKDIRIGKWTIDIFYVICLVAGVVLMFVLEGKKLDIALYLIVITILATIDAWIAYKGEDYDKE